MAGDIPPKIELRGIKKPRREKVVLKPRPKVISLKGCNRVRQLAYNLGANSYEANTLAFIALHESTCSSVAKNPTSSATGLFQFTSDSWRYYCRGNVYDAIAQTRCALRIVRSGDTYNTWYRWWPPDKRP